MKVLDNLKKVVESIEALNDAKDATEFTDIIEKYNGVPKDVLMNIINDVKTVCQKKADSTMNEELNNVDVIPAEGKPPVEHTDTLKAEACQMTELDASENDESNTEDLIINDEKIDTIEDDNDDLIVEEELDDNDEQIKIFEDEEEPEDFEEYQDELDVVEGDDTEQIEEDAEAIDMNIPSDDIPVEAADKAANESAEAIDMNIPSDDIPVEAADKAAKEVKNEANTGAKAAIANRENKGAFSSDVDALTEYLNDY